MSKNPSFETRTLYQLWLAIISLASLILTVIAVLQATKLFYQPPDEPVLTIRQQQLNSAINLVTQPKDVD